MRPSCERMREAVELENGHYANAARRLGVCPDTFRQYVKFYRSRGHWFPSSTASGRNDFWEPTEEEIAAGCAAIQAKWTPEERRRRACRMVEVLSVTRVDYHDDSREMIW